MLSQLHGRHMLLLDLKLGLGRITQAYAGGFDGMVWHFVQLVVAGVDLRFVGGVMGRVVAKKHSPAPVGRAVLVGSVHHVAVKEQAVTRRHLGIDQLQLFEHLIHTLHVGSHLLARSGAVVDAARLVRAANHLQATVVTICAINRHHHAGHMRVQAAVVVPVAVTFWCHSQAPPSNGSLAVSLEW